MDMVSAIIASAMGDGHLDHSPLFEGVSQEEIIKIVNEYHCGFKIVEDNPIVQQYQLKLRKSIISNLDKIPFYKYNEPSVFYKIVNEFYNGKNRAPMMNTSQDALVNFMLSNLKGKVAYIEYSLPSDVLHFASQSYKNFLVRIGNTIKPITVTV